MPRARVGARHFQRTCTTLLLLLSSFLHAAILPPARAAFSTSVSAASASGSSRRAARSVADRLRLEEAGARGGDSKEREDGHPAAAADKEEEEDAERGGRRCRADFVEQFFRILSGPVGREAEAVVAAVLKLLAENDRVDWPALAETDKDPASEKRFLTLNDGLDRAYETEVEEEEKGEDRFGNRHVLDRLDSRFPRSGQPYPGLLFKERGGTSEEGKTGRRAVGGDAKRASPKFNPTGWRRKRRSADPASLFTARTHSAASLQRLLKHILDRPAAGYEAWRWPWTVGQASLRGLIAGHPPMPETEWRNRKRNNGDLQVLRRHSPEQLKRKPLEFNPTGW